MTTCLVRFFCSWFLINMSIRPGGGGIVLRQVDLWLNSLRILGKNNTILYIYQSLLTWERGIMKQLDVEVSTPANDSKGGLMSTKILLTILVSGVT